MICSVNFIYYSHTPSFSSMMKDPFSQLVEKSDIPSLVQHAAYHRRQPSLAGIVQWCFVKVVSGVRVSP